MCSTIRNVSGRTTTPRVHQFIYTLSTAKLQRLWSSKKVNPRFFILLVIHKFGDLYAGVETIPSIAVLGVLDVIQ
jgi:hypothetical protein